MKIKIFFLIMCGLLFSPAKEMSGNKMWSELCAEFGKAVREFSQEPLLVSYDLRYQLIELVEHTEEGPSNLLDICKSQLRGDLFEKSTGSRTLPKLNEIDFMNGAPLVTPSLHRVLLKIAISEVYYHGEKPDFSSPNLSYYILLDQYYTKLKDVLKKITGYEDLEEEELQFLNDFLNNPWDILVFKGQDPEKTIGILRYIAEKTPFDLRAPNILALCDNIKDLNREQFVELIKKAILRLDFDKLIKLVNDKNTPMWIIISHTQHKNLLPTLDLLINILEGKEISSSVPILKKLHHKGLQDIMEILLHKSILNLIHTQDKVKAFKFIDNMSEAFKEMRGVENMQKIFVCPDTSSLFDGVRSILIRNIAPNRLSKDSAEETLQFISKLIKTQDPRCMDLAEKINGIPVEVPKARQGS